MPSDKREKTEKLKPHVQTRRRTRTLHAGWILGLAKSSPGSA